MTHKQLLALIERHLSATGETATAFGRRVARDGRLVHDIRAGRSPTMRLVEKIVAACGAVEEAA